MNAGCASVAVGVFVQGNGALQTTDLCLSCKAPGGGWQTGGAQGAARAQ
ncbi:hypothetical protein [Burkholderia sp. RS02]